MIWLFSSAAAAVSGYIIFGLLTIKVLRLFIATLLGSILGGIVIWLDASFKDYTGVTFVLFFVVIPMGSVLSLIPSLIGSCVSKMVLQSDAGR